MAGRGDDRLSFDRQSEIAERLGYKAHGGLKHVERFMKHYFLVAKDVGDLTRILCASLEARQVKDAPTLSRMLGRLRPRGTPSFADAPDFRLESGRIVAKDADAFSRDPVNLIRLFAIASRQGAEIHPDALKLVRKSLPLIRKSVCNDPQANAIFLEMLTQGSEPETILRMMNEAGVLGRFIPEFGRIVAMMQFNMYHHYTVDEHLIRAVGILAQIDRGAARRRITRLPLLSSRRSPAAARSMWPCCCTTSPRAARRITPSPASASRGSSAPALALRRQKPKQWPGSSAITC